SRRSSNPGRRAQRPERAPKRQSGSSRGRPASCVPMIVRGIRVLPCTPRSAIQPAFSSGRMGSAPMGAHVAGWRSLVAPPATWERVHIYLDVSKPAELLEFACEEEWPVANDGRLVLLKPY